MKQTGLTMIMVLGFTTVRHFNYPIEFKPINRDNSFARGSFRFLINCSFKISYKINLIYFDQYYSSSAEEAQTLN